MRKSDTHLDLCIALLIALYKESIEEEGLFVFGELGLDGKVKSSSMLFPLILSLKEQGLISRAIVPMEAIEYLSRISGVDFMPVSTLNEAITLIQTNKIGRFPIVLVGTEFWGGLLDWVKSTMLSFGNISPKDLDLINLVDSPTEAVKVIDEFYSTYLLSPNF